MNKYSVTIWWSEADQLYLATVPSLPGCTSAGKTFQEAAANVEEAIASWLEEATRRGGPVPEPDHQPQPVAT